MNKKILLKISVLLLLMLILSQSILALGVRPAKTMVDSNEIKEYSGSFWVINNDMKQLNLKVHIAGEMGKYLFVEQEELTLRDDEEAAEVKFSLVLSGEVPPGESVAIIVVEEEIESSYVGVVSSKIVLKHKIRITGDYPDKYVTAKINFQENNDAFVIVTEVENLGKEDIKEIKTKYYVNNEETLLVDLESETESLGQGENKLLKASLDKNYLEKGEFEVLAKVEYDGQVIEVIKNLLYGKPEVEVTYFDRYLTSGIINPYTLELLNKWNKKVENVFVDVLVNKKDEKGSLEEVDSFRTKSIDVSAFTREKIQDYYNAEDKSNGEYIFSMVVNFWNTYKMEQKEFKVTLLSEDESINLVGMAGADNELGSFDSKVEFENNGGINSGKESIQVPLFVVMFIILGVVAIAVISVFVLSRKKREDGWE